VSPSHRLQSFRSRLLQRGSPKGSQALPANLLQHGLLSMGPQVLAGACTRTGSSLLWAHPPALVWSPPWAAGGYLLPYGPPWAAGAQPDSPWSLPQAAGEPLLRRLEHLFPLLLHWPWCLQSSYSSLQLQNALTHFFSFLKHVIPEALPPPLMGLCLALSSIRSVLEPAGVGSVRHRRSFWQLLTEATPAAPPLPKPCHANPILFYSCQYC